MEEPNSKDLEELLKELEEEYGAQESLPPEVEELLHVLQLGSEHLDRRDAAERLGSVETSSPRIVRALRAQKSLTAMRRSLEQRQSRFAPQCTRSTCDSTGT
jgi:hypothetical protein